MKISYDEAETVERLFKAQVDSAMTSAALRLLKTAAAAFRKATGHRFKIKQAGYWRFDSFGAGGGWWAILSGPRNQEILRLVIRSYPDERSHSQFWGDPTEILSLTPPAFELSFVQDDNTTYYHENVTKKRMPTMRDVKRLWQQYGEEEFMDLLGDPNRRAAGAPRPPHDGLRGEKLVDQTADLALWQTGGVPGQRTKLWVITDHTGRGVQVGNNPMGMRRKRDALEAWEEAKMGNYSKWASADIHRLASKWLRRQVAAGSFTKGRAYKVMVPNAYLWGDGALGVMDGKTPLNRGDSIQFVGLKQIPWGPDVPMFKGPSGSTGYFGPGNDAGQPDPRALRQAGAATQWTVYLFSDTGKTLWKTNYMARSERDAEREALRLVKPHLNRYSNAEDWVFEPAESRRAAGRDVFTRPGKKRQRVDPASLEVIEDA
jgi:hypothetical protein